MDKFVIKRNGTYLPFEPFKIEEAIRKAFASVSETLNLKVIETVFQLLSHQDTWAVEDIQDKIEKTLYEYGHGEFKNLTQQMINFIFVELWKKNTNDYRLKNEL